LLLVNVGIAIQTIKWIVRKILNKFNIFFLFMAILLNLYN